VQGGFTLLGLLFLVAGLGVAMAALGTIVAYRRPARKGARSCCSPATSTGGRSNRSGKFRCRSEPEAPAKNFDELLSDPRFPTPVRHLRRVYRDPMTGSTEWGLVKEPDGGLSGVYSPSTDAPFKRAGFPAA